MLYMYKTDWHNEIDAMKFKRLNQKYYTFFKKPACKLHVYTNY